MLVKGPDVVPKYCYEPVSAATLDRVRKMEDLKGTGGKILKTSLSHEDEAKLQDALNAQDRKVFPQIHERLGHKR